MKDYELSNPHEKYKNLLVKGLERRQGIGKRGRGRGEGGGLEGVGGGHWALEHR